MQRVTLSFQVSPPPRSSSERSGPLKTPPHSPTVESHKGTASVAAILAEKFDDVEESFHVDKDGCEQGAVPGGSSERESERWQASEHRPVPCIGEQGPQHMSHRQPSVAASDAVASPTAVHISPTAIHISPTAVQSPSPRTDVFHHQQLLQHQPPPPLMNHVLSSIDNAESALALALQGPHPHARKTLIHTHPCLAHPHATFLLLSCAMFKTPRFLFPSAFDAAVSSVRASGGGANELLPMRNRLQGMAHRVTGSLRSSMEFRCFCSASFAASCSS